MIVAALFLALPLFVQWTVDDDGPADYPSIAAAVAAAPAGATLFVEPGTYGPFTLAKRMSIIGATGGSRPMVSGLSQVVGAPQFTFAGLDVNDLWLQDVPGRAVLTDCEIGHAGVGIGLTFQIDDCAQVLVSNSTLIGSKGNLFISESPGAGVRGSAVCFTNCTITGGDGADIDTAGAPGQPGIDASDGSLIIAAGCTITGGDGGFGLEFCQSSGGGAISAVDSVVYVRGTAADVLAGGHDCPSGTAYAIAGPPSATVTWSGVTIAAPMFSPGATVVAATSPEEPYVEISGDPAPGGVRVLNVYAQAFKPVMVLASLQPALLSTGKVTNGPLWLNPGMVLFQLPLTAAGQDTPAAVPFVLPGDGSLAGIVVTFQAFIPPAAPGTFLGSNAADLTLRF